MKKGLCALIFGIGVVCLSPPPAHAVLGGTGSAGAVIDLSEPVHCRVYPHRHSRARPHGWSRGCPKKDRRPRRTRTST